MPLFSIDIIVRLKTMEKGGVIFKKGQSVKRMKGGIRRCDVIRNCVFGGRQLTVDAIFLR